MGVIGDNKRRNERRVAERFCELNNASLVKMRESPDAEILLGDAMWGLEIASYRSTEPRKRLEHADAELQRAFADARLAAPDTQQMSLTWHYKEKDISLPDVPDFRTHQFFISQLLEMIRELGPKIPAERHIAVRFGPPFRWPNDERNYWVDPARFPLISSHCAFVRLNRTPGIRFLRGGSSMDAGFLGVDPVAVSELADSKCELVPIYRSSMPGANIGLLVHSEILPQTAHIGDDVLIEAACKVFSSDFTSRSNRFDAVWLGQYMLSGEAAKLYRIC